MLNSGAPSLLSASYLSAACHGGETCIPKTSGPTRLRSCPISEIFFLGCEVPNPFWFILKPRRRPAAGAPGRKADADLMHRPTSRKEIALP
eukprot:758092-Hanusia_phi.AAC.2